MKIILAGFLVLSLALNVFLWTRISNQSSQLISAQTSAAETEKLRSQNNETQFQQGDPDAAASDKRELVKLRNQVGLLRKQAGDAEPLRAQAAEAAQLRVQLASATQNLASAESALRDVTKTTVKEKDEAQSTACVKNMKQIALAARMWADDHNDVFPSDFVSMKPFLHTPKVFFCPAASSNQPTNWTQFNFSTVTYRFMNPGGTLNEPEKLFLTCPIHGHFGLSDGSVHRKQ